MVSTTPARGRRRRLHAHRHRCPRWTLSTSRLLHARLRGHAAHVDDHEGGNGAGHQLSRVDGARSTTPVMGEVTTRVGKLRLGEVRRGLRLVHLGGGDARGLRSGLVLDQARFCFAVSRAMPRAVQPRLRAVQLLARGGAGVEELLRPVCAGPSRRRTAPAPASRPPAPG